MVEQRRGYGFYRGWIIFDVVKRLAKRDFVLRFPVGKRNIDRPSRKLIALHEVRGELTLRHPIKNLVSLFVEANRADEPRNTT